MEDATACQMRLVADCPFNPGRARFMAVVEGRLLYDAAAAGVALQTLRDASCDLAGLDLTPYDGLSFFGTFEGTIEPGDPCGPTEQACRRGTCATGGICLGFSTEGEPCDTDPSAPVVHRVCVPDVPSDPPMPERALRCSPDMPGAATGRCLLVLPDGMPCTEASDCASERCAGTCMAKAADGLACTGDEGCLSANCDFSTGRCARPRDDGDLCEEGASCASGYCDRDMKLAAGSCRALANAGDPCEEDAGCRTGYCNGSSICSAPICGL
jgi:hypothetical protein